MPLKQIFEYHKKEKGSMAKKGGGNETIKK